MSLLSKWVGASSLVGLDIGSHTLKLAQLRPKKSSFILESLATLGLPRGTVVEGDVLDPLTLEEAIKELFAKEKIQTKSIAFAVCGSSVISKKISIPAMSEMELEDQISVIASQYIPIPADEMNVDYQLLPVNPNEAQKMDLVVTAVKKDFLEIITTVIEAADLKPTIIETTASALSNAYRNLFPSLIQGGQGGQEELLALLHIGGSLTHFVILEKGTATYHTEIPFGGHHISDEISNELHLNFSEAEALKISSHKEKNIPEAIHTIIEKTSHTLCTQVQETLTTFINQNPKARLDKLHLSGGTSKIALLQEGLAQKTGLSTTMLKPFDSISYNAKVFAPTFLEDLGPLLFVALGLASRSKTS